MNSRKSGGKAAILGMAAFGVLFGASCIRRDPLGVLDPRTAPTFTKTLSFTHTYTMVPSTLTFTSTPTPPLATSTFTNSPTPALSSTSTHTMTSTSTFTITPTAVAGATNTFTVTFTGTYTSTRTFTNTFTPTPAAAIPYVIQGEAAFSWVAAPPGWSTAPYPASEMVKGSPPYTSWTAPTASDAVMYGGYNGVAGTGPTWCTPLTTFTTFQVRQETGDMHSGSGSLRFSGQQGGYTWGGWTYWGLTVNTSWSTVSLDPFLTGLEYWAKDLQPNGHVSTIRIGPRNTDVCDGTDCSWAKAQSLSPSWTQYQHDFLTMDSGWPNFNPITNFTATGPTTHAGLAGSGAGAACNWAYLLDDVRFY